MSYILASKQLEETYDKLNKRATGDQAIQIKKTLSNGPMRPVICLLGSYVSITYLPRSISFMFSVLPEYDK